MKIKFSERSALGKGFEDARAGRDDNPYPKDSMQWEQYNAGQIEFHAKGKEYATLGPKERRTK